MVICGAQRSFLNANRRADEDAVNGSPSDFPSPSPIAPPRAPQSSGLDKGAALDKGQDPQPGTPVWKTEVSDRVRAHRNRPSRTHADQPLLPGMEDNLVSSSSIAARVAERYSRVPSYREMLAAQAAAQAADQIAAEKSQAEALATAPGPPASPPSVAAPAQPACPPQNEAVNQAAEPCQPSLIHYFVSTDSLPVPRATPAQARAVGASLRERPDTAANPSPNLLSDPLEEALVEPAQPLPARVLAFPRELIAPRKARPRLAECPLTDEPHAPATLPPAAPPDPRWLAEEPQPMPNSFAGNTELRSHTPDSEPAHLPEASAQTQEWRTINLDTETPIRDPNPYSSLLDRPRLHVASLENRALAAFVDCAFILSAFLLFSLIFAICTTSLPHGRPALIGACIALFAMWLLYQLLFFSLTNATPGMRYAKIALCTFSDKNPTRQILRTRIAAVLLSALPLGLGFLWAVFDEDSLGWHDRITQTYQRSYSRP